MDQIQALRNETQAVLGAIPPEHQGILFERVLSSFHIQKNTQLLELSFATLWAERNSERGGNLLVHLLHPHAINGAETEPRHELLPENEREWRIAQLVAATVIQWLPTSIGCGFLRDAFERGGGKFSYELPETDEGEGYE